MGAVSRFFWTMVLIFSVLVLGVAPARAFSVSPVRQVLTMDLGAAGIVPLTIKNTSSETQKYFLKVLGVRQNKSGLPEFGEYLEIAEQWVAPEKSELVLKAGESGQARFTVCVPKNYPPGSHYLGLAVAVGSGAGEVKLNQEIVSLLTLQVAGEVNEKAEIEKWQMLGGTSGVPDWKFLFRAKNSGDVVVGAEATVSVWNWRKELVFEKKIWEQKVFLDNSVRELETEVGLGDGFLWPGPYRVKVNMVYGVGGNKAGASVYVWYWPFWFKAGVVVIIFLLLVLFFKRVFKKEPRKNYV